MLRVERRANGKSLPFEAVHQKIADYLEDCVWRQAIRQYIELLVGAAEIKGIALQGSSSVLVQRFRDPCLLAMERDAGQRAETNGNYPPRLHCHSRAPLRQPSFR